MHGRNCVEGSASHTTMHHKATSSVTTARDQQIKFSLPATYKLQIANARCHAHCIITIMRQITFEPFSCTHKSHTRSHSNCQTRNPGAVAFSHTHLCFPTHPTPHTASHARNWALAGLSSDQTKPAQNASPAAARWSGALCSSHLTWRHAQGLPGPLPRQLQDHRQQECQGSSKQGGCPGAALA